MSHAFYASQFPQATKRKKKKLTLVNRLVGSVSTAISGSFSPSDDMVDVRAREEEPLRTYEDRSLAHDMTLHSDGLTPTTHRVSAFKRKYESPSGTIKDILLRAVWCSFQEKSAKQTLTSPARRENALRRCKRTAANNRAGTWKRAQQARRNESAAGASAAPPLR